VLAHFQRGSVAVKAGDRVQRGQLLGKCGNSGNSSEPHLHYQLQHSAIFQDALGIKCVFGKSPAHPRRHCEIELLAELLAGKG
jgi:murein DD-endopeptidase MepM/ murein hydrolase activator NlpD